MAREEIHMDPAGTDEAEVKLAGEMRAAVNRARTEGRMTFVMQDGVTAGAFVPVGVAVAMDPGVVRMSGDTHWTDLPADGMRCAAGWKIDHVSWRAGRPEGHHDDGTLCMHTSGSNDAR